VLLRSQRQVFARTAELLEEGMCGGAVVARAEGGEAECVGIVEGIVPPAVGAEEPATGPERARRLLANAAVFVEAEEMRAFLEDAASQLFPSGTRGGGGDDQGGGPMPPWEPAVS
jgi:hypothetical protein